MHQIRHEPLMSFEEGGGTISHGDRAPSHRGSYDWKLKLALAGAAINLIVLVCFIAIFSVSLTGLQRANSSKDAKESSQTGPMSAHLVTDYGQLATCPASPTAVADNSLPCLQKDGRYLTSEASLGPWKYGSGSGGNSPVAVNGTSIKIIIEGFYLVVAQILIVDALPSPVALLVSVNGKVWSACAHNSTGSQIPCTVATVGHMQPGDWLALRVPQAYRLVDAHFSVTHVSLVRLDN